MQKIGHIAFIVAAVVFAYLILAAAWPAFTSIISTANSSGNWTSFQSTQNALNAAPIWLWFIPAVVGVVGFVWVLKKKN